MLTGRQPVSQRAFRLISSNPNFAAKTNKWLILLVLIPALRLRGGQITRTGPSAVRCSWIGVVVTTLSVLPSCND